MYSIIAVSKINFLWFTKLQSAAKWNQNKYLVVQTKHTAALYRRPSSLAEQITILPGKAFVRIFSDQPTGDYISVLQYKRKINAEVLDNCIFL